MGFGPAGDLQCGGSLVGDDVEEIGIIPRGHGCDFFGGVGDDWAQSMQSLSSRRDSSSGAHS